MAKVNTSLRKLAAQLDHPRDEKIYGLRDDEYVLLGIEEIQAILDALPGDYLTRTTNQNATGVKDWDKPQIFRAPLENISGAPGSGTASVAGFGVVDVTGGLSNNYPSDQGTSIRAKIPGTANRFVEIFISTNGTTWIRALHAVNTGVWRRPIYWPENDGKIYGLKDTGFLEISANFVAQTLSASALPASNFTGNANSVLTTGLLFCTNGVTNIPVPVQGSLLTCFSATGMFGTQNYTTSENPTPRKYYRAYDSGAWSSWIQIISGSGGDVTQAGNNAFTGSNSFTTPPTIAVDATASNHAVRLAQLTSLAAIVSGLDEAVNELIDDYVALEERVQELESRKEEFDFEITSFNTYETIKTFPVELKANMILSITPTSNKDLSYYGATISKGYNGSNSIMRRSSGAGSGMDVNVDLNGNTIQARITGTSLNPEVLKVSITYL